MESEAIKITRGTGSSQIQHDIKFHFSGPGILFNPEKIVEITPEHYVYEREYVTLHNYLVDIGKEWEDIKELCYICGLRAPYHIHPQGFTDSPNSTVDGYEVYVTFRKD